MTRPPLGDGLRLSVGTLTALPVPPPRRVDGQVAAVAMLLAGVPGLLLGGLAAGTLTVASAVGAPPLVAAALTVGALALATRGLHLDGLADTADGLAASREQDQALAVMRRGDVGPAGAATLVVTLLLQAGALAGTLGSAGTVTAAAVTASAVVAGRSVLAGACLRGVPAARASGLGAAVAGTVPPAAALAAGVVTLGTMAVAGAAAGLAWWQLPGAAAAGWAAAAWLVAACVRRLGGVTGDVLGAAVEAAVTAALVVGNAVL